MLPCPTAWFLSALHWISSCWIFISQGRLGGFWVWRVEGANPSIDTVHNWNSRQNIYNIYICLYTHRTCVIMQNGIWIIHNGDFWCKNVRIYSIYIHYSKHRALHIWYVSSIIHISAWPDQCHLGRICTDIHLMTTEHPWALHYSYHQEIPVWESSPKRSPYMPTLEQLLAMYHDNNQYILYVIQYGI